jgi:hypothetical protein
MNYKGTDKSRSLDTPGGEVLAITVRMKPDATGFVY